MLVNQYLVLGCHPESCVSCKGIQGLDPLDKLVEDESIKTSFESPFSRGGAKGRLVALVTGANSQGNLGVVQKGY